MAHTNIKEDVRDLLGCSTSRVGSTVEYRDCVWNEDACKA